MTIIGSQFGVKFKVCLCVGFALFSGTQLRAAEDPPEVGSNEKTELAYEAINNLSQAGIIEAVTFNIGYRSTRQNGERSALKWVSKLMRQFPKSSTPEEYYRSVGYSVGWHTFQRGKKINYTLIYSPNQKHLALTKSPDFKTNKSQKQLTYQQALAIPRHEESWSAVSAATIHNGAKKGYSLDKLPLFR